MWATGAIEVDVSQRQQTSLSASPLGLGECGRLRGHCRYASGEAELTELARAMLDAGDRANTGGSKLDEGLLPSDHSSDACSSINPPRTKLKAPMPQARAGLVRGQIAHV